MTEPSELDMVILAENLTVMAAIPLNEAIKPHKGHEIRINASKVKHLDLPGLQVLLAAAQFWASEGKAFKVIELSDEFKSGLTTLGLSHTIFTEMEAA